MECDDTRIFVQAVLGHTLFLHSLILQVSLAELENEGFSDAKRFKSKRLLFLPHVKVKNLSSLIGQQVAD